MEQEANAVAMLGSVAGLVAATIALTQLTKKMLTRWPVPPMALVYGEALWLSGWRAGWLDVGVQPIGATPWEWFLVIVAGVVAVVLAAMGGATILEQPTATIRRGSDAP